MYLKEHHHPMKACGIAFDRSVNRLSRAVPVSIQDGKTLFEWDGFAL